VWDTGDIYEGSFENDRRHGAGTYRWANGEVCVIVLKQIINLCE
jgi:hypothetical protein